MWRQVCCWRFRAACGRTRRLRKSYALNTLLVTFVFFSLLRWRNRVSGAGDRWLYAGAFVFGLALGAHHVTVALTAPALATIVYSTAGSGFFKGRRLLHACLLAAAGVLSAYLYLPLAASRHPVLNWGDPSTLQRLWWHVTGRQYQVFFAFSPGQMGAEGFQFLKKLAREFGPWWAPAGVALAALGLGSLFRRDRTMFYFLVLVIVVDLAYALNYDIAEDKEAYYLPVFLAVAIAAGLGAAWLVGIAGRGSGRSIAFAVLAAAPLAALGGNFRFNNRSQDFMAHDYVQNILHTVRPQGMLLTMDWQVYSPILYAQEVERQRRDVVAIDVNLLRRSWYLDFLRREYPVVMAQARDPVDTFLEDLRNWERQPGLYDRDIALARRINSRFYGMIRALVRSHMESAPVYITSEIAGGADPELTRSVVGGYPFVPEGLVFRLAADKGFHDSAEPELETRTLQDRAARVESDDVVKLKVLPAYVNMLVNRGRYLARHGQRERAIERLKAAAALDPRSEPARQALAEVVKSDR